MTVVTNTVSALIMDEPLDPEKSESALDFRKRYVEFKDKQAQRRDGIVPLQQIRVVNSADKSSADLSPAEGNHEVRLRVLSVESAKSPDELPEKGRVEGSWTKYILVFAVGLAFLVLALMIAWGNGWIGNSKPKTLARKLGKRVKEAVSRVQEKVKENKVASYCIAGGALLVGGILWYMYPNWWRNMFDWCKVKLGVKKKVSDMHDPYAYDDSYEHITGWEETLGINVPTDRRELKKVWNWIKKDPRNLPRFAWDQTKDVAKFHGAHLKLKPTDYEPIADIMKMSEPGKKLPFLYLKMACKSIAVFTGIAWLGKKIAYLFGWEFKYKNVTPESHWDSDPSEDHQYYRNDLADYEERKKSKQKRAGREAQAASNPQSDYENWTHLQKYGQDESGWTAIGRWWSRKSRQKSILKELRARNASTKKIKNFEPERCFEWTKDLYARYRMQESTFSNASAKNTWLDEHLHDYEQQDRLLAALKTQSIQVEWFKTTPTEQQIKDRAFDGLKTTKQVPMVFKNDMNWFYNQFYKSYRSAVHREAENGSRCFRDLCPIDSDNKSTDYGKWLEARKNQYKDYLQENKMLAPDALSKPFWWMDNTFGKTSWGWLEETRGMFSRGGWRTVGCIPYLWGWGAHVMKWVWTLDGLFWTCLKKISDTTGWLLMKVVHCVDDGVISDIVNGDEESLKAKTEKQHEKHTFKGWLYRKCFGGKGKEKQLQWAREIAARVLAPLAEQPTQPAPRRTRRRRLWEWSDLWPSNWFTNALGMNNVSGAQSAVDVSKINDRNSLGLLIKMLKGHHKSNMPDLNEVIGSPEIIGQRDFESTSENTREFRAFPTGNANEWVRWKAWEDLPLLSRIGWRSWNAENWRLQNKGTRLIHIIASRKNPESLQQPQNDEFSNDWGENDTDEGKEKYALRMQTTSGLLTKDDLEFARIACKYNLVDPFLLNDQGQTALHLAIMNRHWKLVAIFLGGDHYLKVARDESTDASTLKWLLVQYELWAWVDACIRCVANYVSGIWCGAKGLFTFFKGTGQAIGDLMSTKGYQPRKNFLSQILDKMPENPTFENLLSGFKDITKAMDDILREIGLDGALMRDHKGRNALHLLFLPHLPRPNDTELRKKRVTMTRIEAHIATILVQLNMYGCDASQGDKYNVTPNQMWKQYCVKYGDAKLIDLAKARNQQDHQKTTEMYDKIEETHAIIQTALNRSWYYNISRNVRRASPFMVFLAGSSWAWPIIGTGAFTALLFPWKHFFMFTGVIALILIFRKQLQKCCERSNELPGP